MKMGSGAGRYESHGYIRVRCYGHPKATKGHVWEHVLVAEKALGKHLPNGAVIHHINGDGTDNRPCNLVVCNDVGYHMTLHRRMRAKAACGNAGWRKCHLCKQYDAPENLEIRKSDVTHKSCRVWRDRRKSIVNGNATVSRWRIEV